MEYLSLALANARSIPPTAITNTDIGLVQDLQDRMDVAHIQVQILGEIQRHTIDLQDSIIRDLNRNLYDISTVISHSLSNNTRHSIPLQTTFPETYPNLSPNLSLLR